MDEMIEVRVKFLAALADAAGVSETRLRVRKGVKVGDLISEIESKFPGVVKAKRRFSIAVLVNGVARNSSFEIEDDAEVALIPPASGG